MLSIENSSEVTNEETLIKADESSPPCGGLPRGVAFGPAPSLPLFPRLQIPLHHPHGWRNMGLVVHRVEQSCAEDKRYQENNIGVDRTLQ